MEFLKEPLGILLENGTRDIGYKMARDSAESYGADSSTLTPTTISLHQQKLKKQRDTTNTVPKLFHYTAITDRLMTVSLSNFTQAFIW